MFIYLYGPDTYRSRQYLKKTIKDFQTKRDPSGMNCVTFDALKTEPGQILEALVASPFLADKRLVAVENLGQKRDREFWDTLLELAANNRKPDSTVAIFWDEDVPKGKLGHGFFDFLKKQSYSQLFETLSADKLTAWVQEQLVENGVTIDPRALRYLVDHPLAQEMWQFVAELNKLIAYAGQKADKTIGSKEVELLWPAAIDENVFHFLDALLQRNTKQAIKLLHDQWQSEDGDPGKLFGTLIWQFKSLILIKDYLTLNPGATSDETAQYLGLHPFSVKKSLAVLRGFTMERLKAIYRQLLEIDIKTKTGQGELPVLLDWLVADVCR